MRQSFFMFFAGLLLLTAQSNACMCLDFKTIEENIPIYPFIATVKIISKQENNDTTRKGGEITIKYSHQAGLGIEILELFKGQMVKGLTEYDIHSSCEIGIYPGEEWVIFARYDSATRSYYIGGCNPSAKVKNRKGERDWSWDKTYMKTSLQKFFNHPVTEEQYDNGVFRSFYANGNLEWEATYKDHKLEGNRKVYYADGRLCLDQNFLNGKWNGLSRHYNNASQLIEEGLYDNGRCVHCRKWSDYTIDPYSGHFIKTPEYKGNPGDAWLKRESFSFDSSYSVECDYYKTGALEKEGIYNYRDSFCVINNYWTSGQLHYRSTKFWKTKKSLYQQWDERGKFEIDHVYVDDKLVESKPAQ